MVGPVHSDPDRLPSAEGEVMEQCDAFLDSDHPRVRQMFCVRKHGHQGVHWVLLGGDHGEFRDGHGARRVFFYDEDMASNNRLALADGRWCVVEEVWAGQWAPRLISDLHA